jgi:hypothetical protein
MKDQEAVFRKGIDCGEFRKVDPAILTLVFEGMLRAYADWLTHEEPVTRDCVQEEALLEVFMKGATPS